jgi:hypothetical protein
MLGEKTKATGFYKMSLDKEYENTWSKEEVLMRIED